MRSGRALGYGLLAGAGGITLIMLAWLAVSGAQGGGIVLGLLLLFVLVAPLTGAGWYLLARQQTELAAEAAFTSKRRILEADRLFRAELAAELRQVARRPGLPADRLAELAEDLERGSYDTPEWYDAVQLDDADVATLKRYDDLVWERVRSLRDAAAPGRPAEEAVRALEVALDQRRDLLVRGRRAPAIAPSTLLRAGAPSRGSGPLAALAVDDAVSHEGADYLVEGVASYFAEGQTWRLVHLVPSGPRAEQRWLYASPGGLEFALLDDLPTGGVGGSSLEAGGVALPLQASGTASVDVASKAGTAQGVLVSFWRYGDGERIGLAEQWPDGATHAYAGRRVRPTDFDVWPAAAARRGT